MAEFNRHFTKDGVVIGRTGRYMAKRLAPMLVASGCIAQEAPSPIGYTCMPQKSAFSISIDPTKTTSTSKVSWVGLIQYGTEKSAQGYPLRSGSKTISRTCGELTIRFKGGYLNSNVTGQDGAIEFPVIEIKRGKKVLLPNTALAECDKGDSRMEYFGTCPQKWAISVKTKLVSSALVEVAVVRRFSDWDGTALQANEYYKNSR